jgi:hypothetical protein
MSENTEEPLIWTIHGNLPIKDLFYRVEYEDQQILNVKLEIVDGKIVPVVDKDGQIIFIEEYYLGTEAEYEQGRRDLVKRNAHVIRFKGLNMKGEQGDF